MSKPLSAQELKAFKEALLETKLLILECLGCGKLIRNVEPDDFDSDYTCPECGAPCDDLNIYGTE
jgi:predicted RNA-binding Zn-ribbon protein involved in translation (DUF1610 family)